MQLHESVANTRRRFIAHFAGLGLSATLAPGVLWARMGQPTNVVFYARPFGEMELLALAKAYQDGAGFHLKKPAKLDA